MTPIFKPGYLYRCVWERNPEFYYVNYIYPEQSEPDVVYGKCVTTDDLTYLRDVAVEERDKCKWHLSTVAKYAISITELGHIDDFPEYLI